MLDDYHCRDDPALAHPRGHADELSLVVWVAHGGDSAGELVVVDLELELLEDGIDFRLPLGVLLELLGG